MTDIKINTLVDGADALHVNLWDEPVIEKRKKVKGYLKNGDSATIISKNGDHVELKGVGYKYDAALGELSGQSVEGWCHKGFINAS